MRVAAFPADAAFLPALATSWLKAPGNVDEGLIILPSRRAARALAGAFLQANESKSLLLPRIIALGAIDEVPLALSGALELPPAVPTATRQTMLTKLILARNGRHGAPKKLHTAWKLAGDLAALLDEADGAEIDLRGSLPGIVGAELASHWQLTLEFLEIITHAWPAILSEMGMVNPTHRLRLLIDAQNKAWCEKPPLTKIWLVTRDAAPALSRLARTVAELPQGAVILAGYDASMASAGWGSLKESHAQCGTSKLLSALGLRHEEIEAWTAAPSKVPAGRKDLLSRALLPSACLGEWKNTETNNSRGLFRLATRDEHDDATAIAMILRDALEEPGCSAALITPDRGLAMRVTAALQRFGVAADDSAGTALADTPPAVFMRLLAQAATSEFAPLPLLALLKHPLTAIGEPPDICRNHARDLEVAALRGTRPAPGFDGIKFKLNETHSPALNNFLARLEQRLKPVTGLPVALNPAEALRLLIKTAEELSATDTEAASERLWSGEAGTALSELLIETITTFEMLPDMANADIGALFDAVLVGHVVRKPRTKDGHPRVAIWGVEEANLQSVDVAVLGGLAEGIWPAPTEPGPWLSRPMRKAAGLPAAEQRIGLAAHDFFSLCCRCPIVVLAAPLRQARAPSVQARWITRLDALLAGSDAALMRHPAESWVTQLDVPSGRVLRPKPTPSPPASVRPHTLSISDIATLIADPYTIYARKILNINKLDDLDEESDASQFGNIVHAGLQAFFASEPDFEAPETAERLTLMLQQAMRNERPRAALQHWWEARLTRIAGWIVDAERSRRRMHGPPTDIKLEISAALTVASVFTLKGRADRIERRKDGSVFIMDYKTGSPPSGKQVQSGSAPQLPLEAVMAEAGVFGTEFKAEVTELAFWKLSGRHVKGEDKPLLPKPEILRSVIDQAAMRLPELFKKFSDPKTPFLANPHPDRTTYTDTYHGISRRGEWGGEGDNDDSA